MLGQVLLLEASSLSLQINVPLLLRTLPRRGGRYFFGSSMFTLTLGQLSRSTKEFTLYLNYVEGA